MKLKEFKDKIDLLIEQGHGELEVIIQKNNFGFIKEAEQSVREVAKMVVVTEPETISDNIFDTQEEAKEFADELHNVDSDELKTKDFIMILLPKY